MLKTYSARTMADALAQVKKDLGSDAVIVHTRTFRVGGMLGVGGKPVVEITASSDASLVKPTVRRAPTRVVGRAPLPGGAPGALATSIEPKPIRAIDAPQAPATNLMAGGYAPPGGSLPYATHPASLQRPSPPPPDLGSAPAALAAVTAAPPPAPAPPMPQAPVPAPASASPPVPVNQPTTQSTTLMASPGVKPQPKADAAMTGRVVVPSTLEWPPPGLKPAPPQAKAVQPAQPAPPPPSPQAPPAPAPQSQSLHERVTPPPGGSVEQELGELRRMVGQVLQSTRRTEVRSGSVLRYDAPLPEPLMALYLKLIEADVRSEIAEAIASGVRDELSASELNDPQIVRETLLRQIESRLQTVRQTPPLHSERGRATVVALIGPTGVGKTTSVAKLAATYKLRHGRNVGLITADTYRIAAVEQLRTYAGIIGLPLHVVRTPQETRSAIESLREMDVVVLDTAGRSQNDARRLDELKAHLDEASPDQTHLVLSTTVGARVLKRTTERFSALAPDRMILTKLDEAESLGLVLDAAEQTGMPVSYVTTGQEVPDDIEPAESSRLARLILDGPASAEEGVGALEGTPE